MRWCKLCFKISVKKEERTRSETIPQKGNDCEFSKIDSNTIRIARSQSRKIPGDVIRKLLKDKEKEKESRAARKTKYDLQRETEDWYLNAQQEK